VGPFGVVVDEPSYQRDTGSIITAAELRCGCARKGSAKLLANVEAILGSIEVLGLDVPADAEYCGNRAELETAGKPIRPNDLLITAHAYSLRAILVTANTGEFTRIGVDIFAQEAA
jgi:tRNA(fMet)-specific endonuclease VapC